MQYIRKNTNFDNYKTKFIKIPMEIADKKNIKPIDKMVYGCLRNRLNMSMENRMFDEKGYFIFYTQNKLATELGVTLRTVNTSFVRLKDANLIEYVEDTTANKIYLCEYVVDAKYLLPKKEKSTPLPILPTQSPQPAPVEPIFYDQQPPLSWYAENHSANFAHDSEEHSEVISCYSANFAHDSESFAHDSESFAHNKNLYNNNYNNPNNKSIYHSFNKQSLTKTELEGVRGRYFRQLEISHLDTMFGHSSIVGEILDLIVDMHIDEYTVINKQEKPREVVRGVLAKLTPCHIEDVINTYNEQHIDIKFPHAYLKTLIYNTAVSLKAKIDNRIKSDTIRFRESHEQQNHCSTRSLIDQLEECGVF